MSINITVPDNIERAAQIEADASGATVEQYLLDTLADRFRKSNTGLATEFNGNVENSPLLRLIGIAKGGPSDSSVNHDYRPGDPV
jgi:hypothetical protein